MHAAAALGLDLSADSDVVSLRDLVGDAYGDRPLRELGKKMLHVFSQIERVQPVAAHCVQQLAESVQLVAWLRPYKDQTEFENFTSLASVRPPPHTTPAPARA